MPDLHLLLEDAVEGHLDRLPAPLVRLVRLQPHTAAEGTVKHCTGSHLQNACLSSWYLSGRNMLIIQVRSCCYMLTTKTRTENAIAITCSQDTIAAALA